MIAARILPLLFALTVAQAFAGLRLNEFVADNQAGLKDEDGAFSDWIELTNAGDRPCDLAGWTLTDDPAKPKKWAFPAITLAPSEYLLVFASGKDRRDPAKPLHANFKLAAEGDHLTLVAPDGTADALSYPAQMRDVSFGRDAEGQWRFWPAPTPGQTNRHDPVKGPVLHGQAHEPASPALEQSLAISVRVQPTAKPVVAVTLIHRVMQEPEATISMTDNGLSPDAKAGDGIFTAAIPPGDPSLVKPGSMIRWAFRAEDEAGNVTRFPAFETGQEKPRYFGTIYQDPAAKSNLPILHFFPEDARKMLSATSGTRAAVYFEGRFHDNVLLRRRGQFGSIQWPKPKLKFDFNPGDRFRLTTNSSPLDEFNLQSHFNDPSYMREDLAFQFFNHTGTPAPATRFWQARMNGAYYGLFSYVEQVDEDFLERVGLATDGAMYKANGFPSTLARGTANKSFYLKVTRKTEPYADFSAFLTGINSLERYAYIMDQVNLPAMCNEMACQTVLKNGDRLTKNYYMYRSPTTDLWQRMPWDLDGAFTLGLDSENYASPLYGDTQHTQDPGQPIYQNFLLDAILDHKPTREMYLRRLRTLVDEYLSAEAGYFEREVDKIRALIEAEAALDQQKWRIGSIATGVNEIKRTFLPKRRRELTVTYGPAKNLVPEKQTPGLVLEIGRVEYAPVDPDGEFFELINPSGEAVDISGWKVEGAVELTFPPGTVIPRPNSESPEAGALYVVKNTRAFRNRTVWPKGGLRLFFVGDYRGRLSSRGEVIRVRDRTGRIAAERAYLGDADPALALRQAFLPQGEPRLHESAEALLLEFRRPVNSPFSYLPEVSSDLKTWSPAKIIATDIQKTFGTEERVRLSLERSVSFTRFLRVKVTR